MRIALGLEYCGTLYHGWQKQDNFSLVTVQGLLEQALSNIANASIEVTCSGRTDKGVHALGQVVHFDTETSRTEKEWIMGVNHYLPSDIRVIWVSHKPSNFHARYSAIRRRYVYWIDNRAVSASAFLKGRASWLYQRLDDRLMHESAQCLLGEHDFSAFRAVGCQSKSVFRCIEHLQVRRDQDLVIVEITANAFLYHMVRNIVGSLILVGRGEREPDWIKRVLDSGDRTLAGPTAEADGLYFIGPEYKIDDLSRP